MSRIVRGSDLVDSTPNVTGEIWPTVDDLTDYIMSHGQFTLDIPGTVPRSVADAMGDTVNVVWFGADKTGSSDSADAFDAVWQYVKNSFESDAANLFNVTRTIIVPPGTYFINRSVNWTALLAWNIHVEMRGAKIVAGPGCNGKPVIDATAVRGLHIDGGYIESTQPAASAPSCGLLIGPAGTTTCGNNSFRDLKVMGVYKVAAYINIGSETTYHYNCYFVQTNTDSTTYAFIADGSYTKLAGSITSNYTALRASGTLVSFTNNKFYGCHFRNYGGGTSVYLRFTVDWAFDAGCYILAFNNSNFELFQSNAQRNVALSLHGLMETNLSTGVDYAVTFIVPDGEGSGIVGFEFKTNAPHASVAVFNMVNEAGGVSTGTLNLSQCDIRVCGRQGSNMLFANAGNITITGEIRCRNSAMFNLYDTAKFLGTVYTTDGGAINGTPGAKIFSFILYDETTFAGQVLAVGKGSASYMGVQTGANGPTARAEGTGANLDLTLQGKGTGLVRFGTLTANADAPVNGFVTHKLANGATVKLATIA